MQYMQFYHSEFHLLRTLLYCQKETGICFRCMHMSLLFEEAGLCPEEFGESLYSVWIFPIYVVQLNFLFFSRDLWVIMLKSFCENLNQVLEFHVFRLLLKICNFCEGNCFCVM
jgi:hypothetical protein